ncbi:MAG: hypothetical protein WCB04_02490, partial [Mycobacteriales bacterium]
RRSPARIADEGGWAIVLAIVLTAITIVMGLALLAIVDTQSKQAGIQRRATSAFTLAEGILNAQSFALSRAWPEATAHIACTQTTANARDNGCPDPSSVLQQFGSTDYSNSTWTTRIYDNDGTEAAYWTTGTHSAYAFDNNGDGNVWVWAQATVRSQPTTAAQTRTVVGMAHVAKGPAFPDGYGALMGGFQTSLSQLGNNVGSTLSIPLLQAITGGDGLVTGKVGIRCGVLQGCVSAVGATLNETQLGQALGSNVFHYGVTTAASDDEINQLRTRAQREGHYTQTLAAGACPANGASGHGTWFVETIGTGTGTCTITANSSANVMVVANGRVDVRSPATFTGVIYALDRQHDPLSTAVVTVQSGAFVNGGVLADSYIDATTGVLNGGAVAVFPPPLDVRAACRAALGVLSLTCNLPLISDIVNTLVSNIAFINNLTAQVLALTPAITYDCRYFTSDTAKCPTANANYVIKANGNAGTVQSTFRQVPNA